MYKVFIAEDDMALNEAIESRLKARGYHVKCASDFERIGEEFASFRPHIMLLDIMLPRYNGFYWCSEIRKISKAPIVFISSASDDMNIVTAINMGGDDFIAKPFEPIVLEAKLRALLRRAYETEKQSDEYSIGGAVLRLDDACIYINGSSVELTKNEFRILSALLENKGSIVSREQLMIKLWQNDCYVEENTLSVNVARLRKKLEDNGLGGIILTKPGSGYIIK